MAPDEPNRHVAVIAFPFSSHPAALFSLARALASASPSSTFSFISSPGSVSSLSEIPARPHNLRIRHVDEGAPSDASSVVERIGLFLRAAPENLRSAVATAVAGEGNAVTCVVSDAFMWMSAEVAEEMGVPWVAVWTGGTAGLMAHLYTEELRRAFGVIGDRAIHPRADELVDDIIPCLANVRVRDLPEGIVSDTNSPFAHLLLNMVKNLTRAAAVALNAIEGLDPSLDTVFKARFTRSLPVGPFNLLSPLPHHEANDQCLVWLDSQDTASVSYVSFGTIVSLPSSELAELAHGIETSSVRFLWSLRDKSALPEGFLDRTKGKGLVVAWAPQARVLAHEAVGVFVSHCGWSSLMESVAYGVPMICRPVFGDQVMTGRMVCCVWKIGLGFGGGVVTRGELAGALGKLLTGEEEGRAIRETSRELECRARRAVGHGGCSAENLAALLRIVCG